jgi:integrase
VLGPRTVATYAGHFESSLVPFFLGLSQVTPQSCARYIQHRLGQVKRQSLQKELSALRGLLRWLYGDNAPAVPTVPPRALGTPNKKAKRRGPVALTPAEVKALLSELPERGYAQAPVRAWFTVLYETALRPATVAALSVPEHYRKGELYLRITRDVDKARAARMLPLTWAARQALDSVCPEKGLIFGWRDHREQLRISAKQAIPLEKAEAVCPYDLRRARLTHWAESSRNLPGIQHLAGHSKLSTTARYVAPSLRAAEDVLGEDWGKPPKKRRSARRKR